MCAVLNVDSARIDFGGLLAVNDVSFDVKEGEILGLIGPNGAGKTTLFNIISGYLRPTRGRIVFDGRDITGLPPFALARLGISRTFQTVRPFPGLTVLENVMVGSFLRHPSKSAAEKKGMEILEFLGMGRMAKSASAGLTLPSRKRLEIARALALDPKLLLLDEVVAGLNPAEVEETMGILRQISAQGVTILIVEHIMKVIMGICHRVVVLNYGKKIAEGTPERVAGDPEVIAAYLGSEDDA